MSRLLVIGCGGVAQVAISKICQDSETFKEIMIASRTKSKCDDLKAKLEGKTNTKIETAALDADKVQEVIALIESYKPEAVLNVALPYQDLTIMDACLATGVHYIDTANYEAGTQKTLNGVRFMKNAARSLVLQLTLTTHGNGLIRKNLKKQA